MSLSERDREAARSAKRGGKWPLGCGTSLFLVAVLRADENVARACSAASDAETDPEAGGSLASFWLGAGAVLLGREACLAEGAGKVEAPLKLRSHTPSSARPCATDARRATVQGVEASRSLSSSRMRSGWWYASSR